MKKSNKYDKLAFRLAQILIKFNNRERFSKQELAEEFNVDEKTIERDLNYRLNIMPILKDENKRYYLEDYALGQLNFCDIEKFAALCGASELFPVLDRGFITDLLNLKIAPVYEIKNSGFEMISSKKSEFKTLSIAILRREFVSFIYNEKPREICPYKLINTNGIWYLLGDEDGTLKTFTFTKIRNLKRDETRKFEPNDELVKRANGKKQVWFNDEMKEVILHVKQEACEYFLRKKTLLNYEIISHENGLTIKVKIAYDDEILNFVRAWIPFIRIVSPARLKEKMRTTLCEYLQDEI